MLNPSIEKPGCFMLVANGLQNGVDSSFRKEAKIDPFTFFILVRAYRR